VVLTVGRQKPVGLGLDLFRQGFFTLCQEFAMNAFVNLKPFHTPPVTESVWLEWPEILERQQALDTPAWMADWLEAAHQPMGGVLADTSADTWLEIAEGQQPIDTPSWQTEWLDWMDNRSPAKPVAKATAAHTVCPFNIARNTGAAPKNALPWLLSHPPLAQLEKVA